MNPIFRRNSDMPVDIQSRHYSGELTRVGGRELIKIDVRIISATIKFN